jgi:hypothetical protein
MSETVLHLPYGGTSGWSGSQASRERAVSEDKIGITQSRQVKAQRFLKDCGYAGATWKELGDYFVWHHGQATAVLSVLHKEGVILRLSGEKRSRSSVYVLPEYVGSRDFAPHGSSGKRDESFWRNALADEIVLRLPEQSNGFLPATIPIAQVLAIVETMRHG